MSILSQIIAKYFYVLRTFVLIKIFFLLQVSQQHNQESDLTRAMRSCLWFVISDIYNFLLS